MANSGGLRCQYKQVDFTPAKAVQDRSDTGSTKASVVGTALTLDSLQYDGIAASSKHWPLDCEDWVVAFETDNYATEYTISARVSNSVLTLASSPGFVGSKKWVIRGVPKDQRAQLLSYTLGYALLGPTQHASTGDLGGNS